ncbi:MAG: sulfatase-like hydrolase/transferase [Planctomycetota bacterium]
MRIATALAVVGFVLGGCERKPEAPAIAGKLAGRNLLLITLDTTRADRLGCYGYKPAETPTLDALAARGTLFEDALAQVPLTTPSHCSIMTGRYPREHGVRDNGQNALGPTHPTLASIFKEHGYDTAAFLASFVLDSRFGLDRGFDTYSDDMGEVTFKTQPLEWQQTADVVTDRALAWLDGEKDRPFFCWVHYYDPHLPYAPPPAFLKPGLEPYDGELAFVDSEFKRLLEWFEAAKLTDRTLIVVVGDHGEAFGEHGEEGHSNFVYDVNLRVPMIFAHPAIIPAAKRIPAIVELIDVFPTVLDLFGFKPPDGLLCRSLAVGLAGGKLADAAAYAESHFVFDSFGWAEQRALTTTRWKYVSSTKPQLFDRIADVRERENVVASQKKVATKMLAELKARYESMTPGQAAVAELDQAARNAIQSLGYVSGSTRTTDEFLTEGLPDPKEHLELIAKAKVAKLIMDGSDNPKEVALALPLLKSVVQESPNSRVFQMVLGTCSLKAGDPAGALEAFQAMVRIDPQDPQVYGLLAEALVQLDRRDEAEEHFKIALKLDDRNPDVHFRYAELLQHSGRTEDAVRRYEKALELFPTFADAHVSLAHALKKSGRTEEASRHLEQAIVEFEKEVDRKPGDADLHSQLAMIYVRTGRTSQAVAQFRETLRLQPTHGRALLNLGVELEGQGEIKEAEEVLRQATARSEVAADAYLALGILLSKQGRHDEAVKMCEKSIELKPANTSAIQELSGYYLGGRRFADAIRILRIGTEKVPNNVTFLNMLAKLLATCGDAKLRDGPTAVTLASKASQLTQDREPSVLATLAAGHAECGDFPRAIEIARKAVQLAEDAQQGELAAAIRSQLDGYLKNQPFRDPRL